MLSKLVNSAKPGHSLINMKHHLRTPLVQFHYQGMFTIQRQFLLQSQTSTFSLSSRLNSQSQNAPMMVSQAQRFFSSSDSDADFSSVQENRRAQNQNKPNRAVTQLSPHEVFETMRIVVEQPGGVSAMSTEELTQMLNKVNRAIAVAQIQDRVKVRPNLLKFSQQLCEWLNNNPASEVPLVGVAELLLLQTRNRLSDHNLTNIYRQHVQTMLKDHEEMLKELPFYKFATILNAYPINYGDRWHTQLLDMMTERYKNLDSTMKLDKTAVIIYDLVTYRPYVSNIHLNRMLSAANEYIFEGPHSDYLDTMSIAKLFSANATFQAETQNKNPKHILQLISYMKGNIGSMQEQSVIHCLQGCNKLARVYSPLSVKLPDAFKFAQEMHNLVISMCTSNPDLVDLQFITKYLAQLADVQNMKEVCGAGKVEAMLALFNQKLDNENISRAMANYRTDEHLIKILQVFDRSLPTFAENIAERFLEKTENFVQLRDLKTLRVVSQYLKKSNRSEVLINNIYDKLESLSDSNFTNRFHAFWTLHSFPQSDRRNELIDRMNIEESLSSFNPPLRINQVIDLLDVCVETQRIDNRQKQVIEKMIDEHILVEAHMERNVSQFDCQKLEDLLLKSHGTHVHGNPIKEKLLPFYKEQIVKYNKRVPYNLANKGWKGCFNLLEQSFQDQRVIGNNQFEPSQILLNLMDVFECFNAAEVYGSPNLRVPLISLLSQYAPNEKQDLKHQKEYIKAFLNLIDKMPDLEAQNFVIETGNQTKLQQVIYPMINALQKIKSKMNLPEKLQRYVEETIALNAEDLDDMKIHQFHLLCKFLMLTKDSSQHSLLNEKMVQYGIKNKDEIVAYVKDRKMDGAEVFKAFASLSKRHRFEETIDDAEEGSADEGKGPTDKFEFNELLRQLKMEIIQKHKEIVTNYKGSNKKYAYLKQFQEASSLIDSSVNYAHREVLNLCEEAMKELDADQIISSVLHMRLTQQIFNGQIDQLRFNTPCRFYLNVFNHIKGDASQLSKLDNFAWLNLHSLMVRVANSSVNFDPTLHNLFIEDLGDRFDKLSANQCVLLARNMEIGGLNQDDIISAIVSKVTESFANEEEKSSKKFLYFQMLSSLLNLNLQKTEPYNKLMELGKEFQGREAEVINASTDNLEKSRRLLDFLMGAIARDMQTDPEIKPYFDHAYKIVDARERKLPKNLDELLNLVRLAARSGLLGQDYIAESQERTHTFTAKAPKNGIMKDFSLRLASLFDTQGNQYETDKVFGSIQCQFYMPKQNMGILIRPQQAFMIDDKTLVSRYAVEKKILEHSEGKLTVQVVNNRSFNAMSKASQLQPMLIQGEWNLHREGDPEAEVLDLQQKAERAVKHAQVKADKAELNSE